LSEPCRLARQVKQFVG